MTENELNQKHNPAEGEIDGLKVRLEELESLVAERDREIKTRDNRWSEAVGKITEMEKVIADKDGKMATLEQAVAEVEGKLAGAGNSLAQAVSSYKALMLEANPDVLEELITGESIEDIDRSLKNAKTLIGKVRENLEGEIASGRVPAGAPTRVLPDLSALSAREKIQYAIGGKK